MRNRFLFETEEFGNEFEFEDSYESFADEFEFEDEGDYEFEFEDEARRRRGRRRPSGRTSGGNPHRQYSGGRSRYRPAPRPRKPRKPPAHPASYPRFGSAFDYPPPVPEASGWIRLIQRLLNRALGLNLPVDGFMNVETRSAIRSFQRQEDSPDSSDSGFPNQHPSGDAGTNQTEPPSQHADTPQKEYDEFEFYDSESDYFEFEGEVNRQSADYARWIQQSLNKIMGLRLAVDGIIGAQTRSAIRSFQQRQGLTVDGIVGPITESALIRAGAGSPPGGGTSPGSYVPWPSIPSGGSRPSGSPVSGGQVTSPFGWRIHPISGERTHHNGIDIGGLPIGTPVKVTAGGQVISAYLSESAGNMVIVDHGNGFLTKYFHLNSYSVSKGQTVSRGQKIGELGKTGRVTGPHLHYEVYQNGVAVDPAPFING